MESWNDVFFSAKVSFRYIIGNLSEALLSIKPAPETGCAVPLPPPPALLQYGPLAGAAVRGNDYADDGWLL